MAYETGTATDHRDLLLKIKTFIETNATLVGLGQEWAIHEFEQGDAIRHLTNSSDTSLKRAFDRDDTTSWTPVDGSSYANIEFSVPYAISYFRISVSNASTSPKDFDLKYSDDGVIWTTAASYTGITWVAPGSQVFTTNVVVTETHKYWQFFSVDGNSTSLGITELALFEFGDTTYDVDLAAEDVLIAEGPGLSGTDEIFVGFRTFSDADLDYYNIAFNAFTGYVPGHPFNLQPGRNADNVTTPFWNHPMTYYIRANGQSISVLAKVETVYVMLHVGKFFPYATPVQFPLPLVLCGMYPTETGIRYSDVNLELMFKTALSMRFVDGLWKSVDSFPFKNHVVLSGDYNPVGYLYPYNAYYYNWRDMTGTYAAVPIILSDSDGVYGEIDGLYFVSGFNNAVENTLSLGGDTHVIWRNAEQTGFSDYYSLELT